MASRCSSAKSGDHSLINQRLDRTKGKVDSLSTRLNPGNKKYEVNITIVVKDKLSYDDSEKLHEELRKEYLGKEVDINLSPTF